MSWRANLILKFSPFQNQSNKHFHIHPLIYSRVLNHDIRFISYADVRDRVQVKMYKIWLVFPRIFLKFLDVKTVLLPLYRIILVSNIIK